MRPRRPTSHDEAADAVFVGGEEAGPLWEPSTEAWPPRLSGRLEHKRLPSRLELYLEGELDADTSPRLRENLAVLAERSASGLLVLDLSGITFCDSAGLYTLLGVRQVLPLAGIEVVFTQSSTVMRAAAGKAGLTVHLSLRGHS
ncbi:STAS domain-containing protein [Streptomyces sp. NPDC006285]|uniref:STAS domain-containing protein n=1 Tax=Streptomyces sp. NPDC006285 TaxID=3364742 RepID=UPI0036BD0CB5